MTESDFERLKAKNLLVKSMRTEVRVLEIERSVTVRQIVLVQTRVLSADHAVTEATSRSSPLKIQIINIANC